MMLRRLSPWVPRQKGARRVTVAVETVQAIFLESDPAKMHQRHTFAQPYASVIRQAVRQWQVVTLAGERSMRVARSSGRRAEIVGMQYRPTQPRCATAGRLNSRSSLSRRATEGGVAH